VTKFILIKTWVSLGVLSVTITLTLTLALFENKFHQEVKDLEKQLSSLNHIATQSHEAATLIKANEREFAAFEACGFERSFISETLPSSPSYTIEFGPNSPLAYNSQNDGVVFQEVSFSIPCLQDRDVFRLLEKLTNEGPGLFHIQEVTISRMSPLSEEMLEKIAAGKPQPLFDGRISAIWIHR
jgi:hypothetical protein